MSVAFGVGMCSARCSGTIYATLVEKLMRMAVLLIATPASCAPATAQSTDSCRKCLVDASSTLGSEVATNAVIAAIGGAILGGGLPGAVCGAVLGAASGLANNVIQVLKCQATCKAEGIAR